MADVEHERQAKFITTRFEKWFLPRMAERLPGWVLPDHLTILGLIAASGIAAAYIASNRDLAWLWAVNGLLVVHWFGDSLDGTLARVRRIQRPRYGFYLDHIADAYATAAIGLGLGWSPFMLLGVALAIVVGYLVLSINVYLETYIFGKFRYGYGIVGPTEARLLLIALNVFVIIVGPLSFTVRGLEATVFDVTGVIGVLGMTALLTTRVGRNLRTLGALEPANTVKDDPGEL